MPKEIIKPFYKCDNCNYEWQLVYYSDDVPDLKRCCSNCGKIIEPIRLK